MSTVFTYTWNAALRSYLITRDMNVFGAAKRTHPGLQFCSVAVLAQTSATFCASCLIALVLPSLFLF